ncbi:hypothetical protein NDI52_30300 [Leptolyngbya sp. PL-A3]|uniref:hypothetical protein n=1 Tax=Leptolyngbya sp. PL-A3 TaxID=2933911 RepID=UPI003299A720
MSSAPLTILNRDYLAIIHTHAASASKAVQRCAAKLIQIFERFTLWKLETCKLPLERAWFWIPIFRSQRPSKIESEQLELIEASPQSLYDELNGEHCKDVIQKAVKLLTELGLVHRRRDPRNGQNRTFYYLADLEKLKKLKALVRGNFKKTSLKDDRTFLKDDTSSFKRERSRMISSTNSVSSSSSNKDAVAEEAVLGERENANPIDQSEPFITTSVVKQPLETHSCSPVQGVAEGQFFPPPAAVELKIDWNEDVQEAARKFGDRIPNALEYVRQGIEEGWAKQPTGLFITALRKGRKPQKKTVPPKPKERVDMFQVEGACQGAFMQSDHAFIQARLKGLVRAGMTPEVEALRDRHPEWGFQSRSDRHA